MTVQYNVVFEGKLVPGKDVNAVKKELISLLKVDDAVIDRLFLGKPVIVKKNVDAETAEDFKKSFESAGALCTLRPIEGMKGQETTSGLQMENPHIQPNDDSSSAIVSSKTVTRRPLNGKIIVTNIESVPGMTIVEHFGLVSGSTIRAKHIGRDIMASLKNLVGGELKGYTQLLQESRKQAMDRMVDEARQLGANAIINVRFSTSSVAQGAAELYAYGTAVCVE